jgi:4-hydroxy-tetrahydrodipicolinate synthase
LFFEKAQDSEMMIGKFHGVIPAMATPFSGAEESFDESRFVALIDWYIESGVHGISVAGSQGEFFALEEQEHLRLLELAVKCVNGRVPLLAGTGRITTRETIRITKAAERMGIDLAMIITPFFVQPNQSEMVEHIVTVARQTKLPVLIYNNPPRTGVNVLPPTLKRCMAEAENVVGIKDSSGDVTQSVEYKLITDRKALLFSGRDTIALSLFMHGADGTISPAANVFPKLVVKMYDAFSKGDYKSAAAISDVLAPLREAWAWGSFPVVIKEAMTLVGQPAGPARRPIAPLSAERRADLKKVIVNIEAAAKPF